MSRDNLVKGVLLVLVSWVLVLIYTTLRFEFKFAVSAVTAVLHDVIITMGFVSVFDKEWNILVLTAILTLIGYSINDTIVIFDRIRENTALKLYKNFRDLLDVSFNQTLSRTLATGGAVLLALLAIMFVGGQVINAFAFVLFIGMIAGTYSSIFVASSLVLMWTEAAERSKRKKELRATPAAG
jgi:preprotein translocase subunit SecF